MSEFRNNDPSEVQTSNSPGLQKTKDKKGRLDYTVRTFVPEQWGEVDRFATFFAASFPEATSVERCAVSGVRNHFRKSLVLRAVARRLVSALAIDREQLSEKGFTPAHNAEELGAIVENVFTELYSAVDCARKVLSRRFPVRGMPDSTRRAFSRARSGVLDKVLPPELLSAFKEAHWFDPLRVLRDEITHSDLGSVSQDSATGSVSYMHTGLGTRDKAFVINDVFRRMDTDLEAVNLFLGKVFHHLNTLLKDVPTVQLCGIHQGKALVREIRPEPEISFDTGKCLAVTWIEVDGKPACPLLCGAYWTAKSGERGTT